MFFVAEMFTYNVLVVLRQEKMKPSRKIKDTNDKHQCEHMQMCK